MITAAWRRFLGLGVAPLVLCSTDAALTLAGQAAAYWSGAYHRVNEASPTFHHLLTIHPAAFAAGIAAWMAIFLCLIILLPDTLALIVSLVVTIGHATGAATWLIFRFRYGYQACNGLFLLTAVILALALRWGWQAAPAERFELPPATARWRWPLVAALVAAAVYLFLLPR